MIYIFCIPCTFLLPSHSSWSSPLPISILLPTVDIGDLDPTMHGVLIYFLVRMSARKFKHECMPALSAQLLENNSLQKKCELTL